MRDGNGEKDILVKAQLNVLKMNPEYKPPSGPST